MIMLKTLSRLFSTEKRVLAVVFNDGKVLIFNEKNFERSSHLSSYVTDDLEIIGNEADGVQSTKIDYYDGVIHMPEQTLYSIPYDTEKRPDTSPTLPKSVRNAVWNFLEGAEAQVQIKMAS